MISKKETIHALQVSTPSELKMLLPDVVKERGTVFHYVALAVNNPEIMVCPFQLDGVENKEIKNCLVAEAVEFLSLPTDAIELDYQVFESAQGKTRGIYVCFPKKLLDEYISALNESGYIPVKVLPSILAGVDSFLSHYKEQKGRFCLLDFSKDNMIYFAVFSNGHCDFLREIPFENDEEVEHEVIQSLRCACGVSSTKKFDHVYFSGDVPNKTHLIKKVRELFCEEVTHGFFTDIESSLRRTDNIFKLNLIKKKSFSLKQRKIINQTIRTSLTLCSIIVIGLSALIYSIQLEISRLKSSNKPADYQYAQEIKEKLQAL